MMKGSHDMRFFLVAVLALFVSVGVTSVAGRTIRKDIRDREAMARYYLMEGAKQAASSNNDAAAALYMKAYEIDSTYLPAAFLFGTEAAHAAGLSDEEGVRIAAKYVDNNPDDYYSALIYANYNEYLNNAPEAIRVLEKIVANFPQKTNPMLYLADFYALQKRHDDALAMIDRYELAEGMSTLTGTKKASYRLASGDTLGAFGEIDRLIAKYPTNKDYYLLKGKLNEYMMRLDSALASYVKADRVEPGSGEVKEHLAALYDMLGDSVAYDHMTYEALMSEDLPQQEKVQILATFLQKLLNKRGDTARGDTLFATLSSQYPHQSEILKLSARYNAAKGNIDKAIEDMRYAIDLNRTDESQYSSLMLYYLNKADYAAAVNTFKEASAALDGLPDEMRILYTSAAQGAGDPDEAIRQFDILIKEISPRLSTADLITDSVSDKSYLRNLSLAEFEKLSNYYQMAGDVYYTYTPKRLDDTFRCYETALYFDPDNLLALNNYAYFIVEELKPDVDSDIFRKAKKMSKTTVDSEYASSTFLDTYAWILFYDKEYKEARQYQSAAIEMARKEGVVSYDLFSHMGDILFMNGDVEGALENWNKALELDPSNELLKRKIKHKTFFFE